MNMILAPQESVSQSETVMFLIDTFYFDLDIQSNIWHWFNHWQDLWSHDSFSHGLDKCWKHKRRTCHTKLTKIKKKQKRKYSLFQKYFFFYIFYFWKNSSSSSKKDTCFLRLITRQGTSRLQFHWKLIYWKLSLLSPSDGGKVKTFMILSLIWNLRKDDLMTK